MQNSLFYTGLAQPGRKTGEQLGQQIAHQVGLWEFRNNRIRNLSHGQQKRVNIANALLAEEASVLILDEPTSGLDWIDAAKIMQILQTLCRQGRTVICITHHWGDIQFFDQVVVVDQGRIKAQGSPSEIASQNHCRLGDISCEQTPADMEDQNTGFPNQGIQAWFIDKPFFLSTTF